MKVFHIDCSVRGSQSISRELSASFIKKLKAHNERTEVDYLDLSENQPKEISADFISSNYCLPAERTQEMRDRLSESDGLIKRMQVASVYVIGMPMHNFCIPSNFKVFIDNVVRTGMTFQPTERGAEGLLKGKKVYIINTRGIDFSNPIAAKMDHLEPYLRTVLGFMGLVDVNFINVYPVKWGSPEVLSAALTKAEGEISEYLDCL